MITAWFRSCVFLCALVITIGAMGCSSSDGDDDSSNAENSSGPVAGTINVSGGYVGERSNTNGSARINFDFDQDGTALTGSFTDSSIGSGVVNGTIVSNRLEFTTVLGAGDLIVEWEGTANSDATVLQGTWTVIVGGDATGEWTVVR